MKTISALLPLLLADLPPEHADRLVTALNDPRRLWPAYPSDLVARHGFNEFYDPLDGSPVGEPEFGWATLAADLP